MALGRKQRVVWEPKIAMTLGRIGMMRLGSLSMTVSGPVMAARLLYPTYLQYLHRRQSFSIWACPPRRVLPVEEQHPLLPLQELLCCPGHCCSSPDFLALAVQALTAWPCLVPAALLLQPQAKARQTSFLSVGRSDHW